MKSAFVLFNLAALIVATASAAPNGGKEENNSNDTMEKRFKELAEDIAELKKSVEKRSIEDEALNDQLARQKVENAAFRETTAALHESDAQQRLEIAQMREAAREENAKQKNENKKRQADSLKREEDVVAEMKKIVATEMEKYRAAHHTCETGMSEAIAEDGRYITPSSSSGYPNWKYTITFARAFPRPPTFMWAVRGFGVSQRFSPDQGFINSGNTKPTITTTSAVVTNDFDKNIRWVSFNWIACL